MLVSGGKRSSISEQEFADITMIGLGPQAPSAMHLTLGPFIRAVHRVGGIVRTVHVGTRLAWRDAKLLEMENNLLGPDPKVPRRKTGQVGFLDLHAVTQQPEDQEDGGLG